MENNGQGPANNQDPAVTAMPADISSDDKTMAMLATCWAASWVLSFR